jgi:lipoprotein-anchoring transpeptidase ErfK/SrfK
MLIRSRSLLLLAFGCGLTACILLLSSCGSASNPATKILSGAQPAATVAYRPPLIVHLTPTSGPKAKATATPRPAGPPPPPPTPPPPGPSPSAGHPSIPGGQVILVSLSQQWLWAYQNGVLLFDTPVTTGMPQLPTPDGTFSVQYHEANVMFYSPWPPSSPYYYAPEHVNYALYFAYNGYFIHDAPWRQRFGPGTNYPHTDPDGAKVTGSHGCVELPTPAAAWVYNWVWDGATILIYGAAPVPPAPTATPKPTSTSPPAPTATPTNPPTPTPSPTA